MPAPAAPRARLKLSRPRGPSGFRSHRCDGAVAQAFESRPGGLLLSLLLGGSMASPKRLSTCEHHRRVLALVADTRALAVIEWRLAEPFLRHLLEPAFEVLVLGRGRERAVAVEVIVVSGVVSGIKEHRAQHSLESIREQ